jgi:HemY protein
MKFLILALLALVGAVATTRLVNQDPGHVLLSYGGYTVETSLAVTVAVVLIGFVAFYALLRLLLWLYRAPHRWRAWRRQRRMQHARQDLQQGLMLMAEGRWGQAEQRLSEHAADAETPLLNFLTAARAAQMQKAYERRDIYLGKATRSMPRAGTAVALTQAELQYDHAQWEQALATLSTLRQRIPKHPRVLALLAMTYQQLGDWPRLMELVDELRRHHALEPGAQRRLENGVHRHQLEQVTDAEELQQLWNSIPARHRDDLELVRVYVDRLMATGAHASAEKTIRRTLERRWDDDLCDCFGRLQGGDASTRMKQAERWLKDRPSDPVLLLAAGRIAVQAQLWGIARRLLEASLAAAPSPAAYHALGALLEQLNETPDAMVCYRKGLEGAEANMSPLRLRQSPESGLRLSADPASG